MGVSTDKDGLSLADKEVPIIIRGAPDRLQGTVVIQNNNDQRITLKSMPVEASDLKGVHGTALDEVHVFGRINPKTQAKVRVEFPIDPATAAGTYQINLRIGSETFPATIMIDEQYELEVEPDTLTLHAAESLEFEHIFTVTNTGNVPVHLGQSLVVPVTGDGGLEYAISSAFILAAKKLKSSKRETGLNDFLAAVGGQFPGPASFHFQEATLNPGESRTLRGALQLPNNLQANHHYSVSVDLYSSAINFDVFTLPTASGNDHSKPPVIK
jgi:hypothetical protein